MNGYVLLSIAAARHAAGRTGLIIILCAAIVAVLFLVWSYGEKAGRRSAEDDGEDCRPDEAPRRDGPSAYVQDGISEEVVAAIAAAVASMAPEGRRYSLRNVRRADRERPVWAAAGLAESTRPF